MVYVCYLCHKQLSSEDHFNYHMEHAYRPVHQNAYNETENSITDVTSESLDGNGYSRDTYTTDEV